MLQIVKLRTCSQISNSLVHPHTTRNCDHLYGNKATSKSNIKNMCPVVKGVRNFNIISDIRYNKFKYSCYV